MSREKPYKSTTQHVRNGLFTRQFPHFLHGDQTATVDSLFNKKKSPNIFLSDFDHNRTFTSTQGKVHSRRPVRLRSHSKPTPVHSSGLDSTPSRCCALSSTAPANAFAVELNVSKTNSANPSPGTGTSVVALLGTKDSTGAELYRGANQLLRRSKIHLSDQ